MKKLLFIILLTLSFTSFSQQIVVGGWNASVTLPSDYNFTTVKYPTLIFYPGLGEVGTNYNALIQNGPHAYLSQGGTIPGFIVISLQPSSAYPTEYSMNTRLDLLKGLYRIDINRINLTGLSHGGWCSSTYVSGGYPNIKSIITVQGVIPDDNSPYPQAFSNWFGRHLCFEQRLDGRGGLGLINYINSIHPGQGIFIETSFGGGGHCCWNQFYGGQGTQPTKFMLDSKLQNIYEWLASVNTINIVAINLDSVRNISRKTDFYFTNTTLFIKSSKSTQYNIFNSTGQLIDKGFYKAGNATIPIDDYKPGIYFIKTEFTTYKFIK
jgi:hypothetical protein